MFCALAIIALGPFYESLVAYKSLPEDPEAGQSVLLDWSSESMSVLKPKRDHIISVAFVLSFNAQTCHI